MQQLSPIFGDFFLTKSIALNNVYFFQIVFIQYSLIAISIACDCTLWDFGQDRWSLQWKTVHFTFRKVWVLILKRQLLRPSRGQ